MTSYFRPDIKGDAARKEMVLSQCTGPFFFFEQKVSFQMLTKVRCHLILKGRCVETSEAPNSVPESHYSIPFQLVSSFQIPQPPQTYSFISSLPLSFICSTDIYWAQNQRGRLDWSQAKLRYFLGGEGLEVLLFPWRIFSTNSKLTAGTGVWDAEGQESTAQKAKKGR